MSLARTYSWARVLCLLIAAVDARVALFDLLSHKWRQIEPRRQNGLHKREETCLPNLYLSIISAEPLKAEFCYKFDPTAYSTVTSVIATTTPITYVTCSDAGKSTLTTTCSEIYSATTTYFQTAVVGVTTTVSVTSTATDTSFVLKSTMSTTSAPTLVSRDLEAAILGVIAAKRADGSSTTESTIGDASELSSITSALKEACTCLHLPLTTTVTSTSIASTSTQTAVGYDVSRLTKTSTGTLTVTIVTRETVVISTDSIPPSASATTSLIKYPEELRVIPIAQEITCPGADNTTESVLIDEYRYDYLILCDTAVMNVAPYQTFPTRSAADCETACAEFDNSLSNLPCHSWEFQNRICTLYPDGGTYMESKGPIVGVLVRVAAGSHDNATVPSSTSTGSIDSSAIINSITSGITHVTPHVASGATGFSTCFSFATTYPNGAWTQTWNCTYSSSWWEYSYTTYILVNGSSTTITRVINNGDNQAFTVTGSSLNGGISTTASGTGGQLTTAAPASTYAISSASHTGTTIYTTTIISNDTTATYIVSSGSIGVITLFSQGGGGGWVTYTATGTGGGPVSLSTSTSVTSTAWKSTLVSSSFHPGGTKSVESGGSGGGGSDTTTFTTGTYITYTRVISSLLTSATGGHTGSGTGGFIIKTVKTTITSTATALSTSTSTSYQSSSTNSNGYVGGGSDDRSRTSHSSRRPSIPPPYGPSSPSTESSLGTTSSGSKSQTSSIGTAPSSSFHINSTWSSTPTGTVPTHSISSGSSRHYTNPTGPPVSLSTGTGSSSRVNSTRSTPGTGTAPAHSSSSPPGSLSIPTDSRGRPSHSSTTTSVLLSTGPGTSGFPIPSSNGSFTISSTLRPSMNSTLPGTGTRSSSVFMNSTTFSHSSGMKPSSTSIRWPTSYPMSSPNTCPCTSSTATPMSNYTRETKHITETVTKTVYPSTCKVSTTRVSSHKVTTTKISSHTVSTTKVSTRPVTSHLPPAFYGGHPPAVSSYPGPFFSGPHLSPQSPPPASTSKYSSTSTTPSSTVAAPSVGRRLSGQTASPAQIAQACIWANQPTPTNIIYNPGFEMVDLANNAPGWATNNDQSGAFIAVRAEDQHTNGGSRLGRFIAYSTEATVIVTQSLTLCTNSTYGIILWQRQANPLMECVADVKIDGETVVLIKGFQTQWTQEVGTYTVNNTVKASSVDLSISVKCGGTPGTVTQSFVFEIDDVAMIGIS